MNTKNKQRTATVTWITYNNFGTYLQAYALQRVIHSLGYENHIISDRRFVEALNKKPIWWRILAALYHFLNSGNMIVKGRKKSDGEFNSFADKYLLIDKGWQDYSDLDRRYDMYLCGSDQIWSPILQVNPYYYLGFTDKKKIAYAPSVGQYSYSPEWKEQVEPLLNRFLHLSVRERQGAKLLQEFIDKPIEVVLDPTLLLPSEDWYQLVGKQSEEENPYVLCYFLTYNPDYIKLVRKFARDKGLPLKFFITDKKILDMADIPLFVGPLGFLKEIRNATYFFTDSFHGSIFAIHFEKRFWTFKRFKADATNNQNSRIEDLFSLLNISEYFVDADSFEEKLHLPAIDFLEVKERLKQERIHSLSYLTHSLEA